MEEVEKGKASVLAEAIFEYIMEEGEGKITVAEAVGVLELVKLSVIEEMT